MNVTEQLHLAIHLGSAGLALALVAIVILYLAYDKQRARFIALQGVMEMYMRKAIQDRNDKVRIPADQVQAMFDLFEVRTIPKFKPWPRREKHPALQAPNRGKG